MGEPKLLLEYRGKSLLARVIGTARTVCERVVVVVGAYAELYRPEAERAGAEAVDNPTWDEGLASSLRAGIERVMGSTEWVLVLLADQPFVQSRHLRTLLATADTTGAELVFSRYPDGTLGVPAVVHRRLFPEVAALKGERGARALIPLATGVAEVTLPDARDIDTPEEAKRWLDEH